MGVYEVMWPSLDACSQMDFISFLELSASSDTIEQSYPENFFFKCGQIVKMCMSTTSLQEYSHGFYIHVPR